MIEDDKTVEEMRREPTTGQRLFMSASEMRTTRVTTLRVTQARLAEQLIKPDTGTPVATNTISVWEAGLRPIPLWAARRVRELAEVAHRYDLKREMGE